jgi:hypothetical protein
MDDLAIARGDAIGDPAGHFGDRHVVSGARGRARDCKSDHASADHQNLHCRFLPSLRRVSAARLRVSLVVEMTI